MALAKIWPIFVHQPSRWFKRDTNLATKDPSLVSCCIYKLSPICRNAKIISLPDGKNKLVFRKLIAKYF